MAGIRTQAATRELFGWAMFDFANSSYTTVIITVVYSVIFPRIIVGDAPTFPYGNFLWSVALAVSNCVVLLCAPVLGAVMDYSAAKKRFLLVSTAITVLATAALFCVRPGDVWLGIALIVCSNIGFMLGESFIASFLPALGPPERLGAISGYAWGMGYFGGLASTAIVLFGLGALEAENFSNLRYVGPITAVFFGIAAIPTFIWLREPGVPRTLPGIAAYARVGFQRLRATLGALGDFRDLAVLLLSYLFAYAGLSVVISFAFIYGDQVVRWSPMVQMSMFIVTQVTAACGALAFGHIQDRAGPKPAYAATLLLWITAVVLIFFVDDITAAANRLGGEWQVQHLFLVIGSVAGLGLGATQSSCRAMVGVLSPLSKSGEFFGLWGMANRLAAVCGLMALGFLQAAFGLRNAFLICIAFFAAALAIGLMVNVDRGRAAARSHEGE